MSGLTLQNIPIINWRTLAPSSGCQCPDCGADLLDISTLHDPGLRRICVGPVKHYWRIPPVEEIYPDMPTFRQRRMLDYVRFLDHEVLRLAQDPTSRYLVESRLQGIRLWADMIGRDTEWPM